MNQIREGMKGNNKKKKKYKRDLNSDEEDKRGKHGDSLKRIPQVFHSFSLKGVGQKKKGRARRECGKP